MSIVIVGMIVVIVGFFGLALTDRDSVRSSKPGLRTAAVVAWVIIVLAGWAFVVYFVIGTPGGSAEAWSWVRDQSATIQAAMWLFLLPWMGALWISQTAWAEWLRISLITGLALLTIVLSLTQSSRARARR